MNGLSVNLSISPFLLFISLIVIVAVTYLFYRDTVPRITGGLKAVLVSIRSFGIAVIVLLLFEPMLTISGRDITPPRVAMIIDNSKSMRLIDGEGDRSEMTKSFLDNRYFRQLDEKGKLVYYKFDRRAERIDNYNPDNIVFNGPATKIEEAIRLLQEDLYGENIRLGVLVSDGNYNEGVNPAHRVGMLGIPLVTVGIGDSLQQRDLLVSRIRYNDIAYVERETPVNVRIKSSGYGGERVSVTFTGEEEVIEEKYITLEYGTAEYDLTFSYKPQNEGVRRFEIQLEELPGEITYENNRRSFYIRALERHTQVLMIAGAPSQDVPFLRRVLERDEDIEVELVVRSRGGGFYGSVPSPERINEADLILLLGFPAEERDIDIVNMIKSRVEEENLPILYFDQRNADIREIESLLPVAVERVRSEEVATFAYLPDGWGINPVIGREIGLRGDWNSLPPVYRRLSRYTPLPGSDVLLLHRSNNMVTEQPFLLTRSIGGRKSAAILGYGLWRWRMHDERERGLFDSLILELVHWLMVVEDEKRVRVSASAEQFGTHEEIEFLAQVYDEHYTPFSDAGVKVTIRGDEYNSEVILSPVEHGRYEGKHPPLPEGEYEYIGVARFRNQVLGEDDGRFTVGAVNIEYFDTRMNIQLLRQLASITGGKYLHPDEVEKLEEYINTLEGFEERVIPVSTSYRLINLPLALAVMIFFFSLEWFLRKRSGML